MGIFLDNDELTRLTGREQHAAQKRYLNRKQIPFEENAFGEILVSRQYIERRLSGGPVESTSKEYRPNFDRIMRHAAKA